MSIETVVSLNPQWDFGDRLRKVRRSVARMNQREMAGALGITQKAYAAWESGLNRPKDIVAVAKQIESMWPGQVMSAWLLGVDGDSPRPPTPPAVNIPVQDRPVRHLRPVDEPVAPDPDIVSEEALAYLDLAEVGKQINGAPPTTNKPVGVVDTPYLPARAA